MSKATVEEYSWYSARSIAVASAILLALLAIWFMLSEQIVPAPQGISNRYVVHVGPMLRAGVEDTEAKQIVLWYDLDTGPDLKSIDRLESGDWVVVLTPRK